MDPTPRKKPAYLVLCAALILFLAWIAAHHSRLLGDQNDTIRISLSTLFAILVLAGRKSLTPSPQSAARRVLLPAVTGSVAAIAGIMFDVKQLEWIGLLALLFACLKWSLPRKSARDILTALFLFYWVHPAPGNVFLVFQMVMQRLSVNTSEWLLHMLNVRVWADGLVLRTGFNTYEVPAWCSGMSTATTVFLLAIGLCTLKRFRWYETLVAVSAAVIQALVLNVLRISAMVILVARLQLPSAVKFLHDTTALIVISAVFLVYIEITLWEGMRRRRKETSLEINPGITDMLSEYPPAWRFLARYKGKITAIIMAVLVAAGLAWKSRPFHRAEMIKTVVGTLRDAGYLAEAEHAALEVLKMQPHDTAWQLTCARIFIMRSKFAESVELLEKIRVLSAGVETDRRILLAYSFMGMNDMDRAVTIIQALPDDVRDTDPRVAMILTEQAFFMNDPDTVATRITTAASWHPNQSRIRRLYPFLGKYRKWDAIADSDSNAPYTSAPASLAAIEANMNLRNPVRVAALTLDALARWPGDPRILQPLYFMSIRDGDGKWESRFAEHLSATVPLMVSNEEIYPLFEKCFGLGRPDLAWFLYNRMLAIDSDDPLIYLVAARYGSEWFSFRRRFLNLSARAYDERIDIRDMYRFACTLDIYKPTVDMVPLGRELSVPDPVPVRKQLLEKAITGFRKRDKDGAMSSNQQRQYVLALEMAGDADSTVKYVEELMDRHPESRRDLTVLLSEVYERKADWQNVYETLRDYLSGDPVSDLHLEPMMRLCRAQAKLHLDVIAMRTARRMLDLYPGSPDAAEMSANLLLRNNMNEQALHLLLQPRPYRKRILDMLEAEALRRTQRYVELQNFARARFLTVAPVALDSRQAVILPPAELSLLWHQVYLPSADSFSRNAAVLRHNLPSATSPFMKNMITLWLEEYGGSEDGERRSEVGGQKSEGGGGGITAWEACGRTPEEKAIALNQLTLLLCLTEDFAGARQAAAAAVKWMPDAPVLWHILISLSHGDAAITAEARANCPRDPEIWLAGLVTGVDPIESWSSQAEEMPCAYVTRAAEFLFRTERRDLAATLMRRAVGRARGLVAAHVMGVKCALYLLDREWALECTRSAIAASLAAPNLLYEQFIQLSVSDGDIQTDSETLNALRNLCKGDPDNVLWRQMLGYVRFQRGGWEIMDAMNEMMAAIDAGTTNRMPYVIAAEASRLLGNHDRACDLLRKGLEKHPGDIAILNNLAFTLADSPGKATEALDLIPSLTREPVSPQILDTISEVYLRAGKLDDAQRATLDVLKATDNGTREWFRGQLHLAEIALARDSRKQAEDLLRQALSFSKGIPYEDILRAKRLLAIVSTEADTQ